MQLTQEQVALLISNLSKLTDKQWTITGATDWPILLILGGLIVSMIAFMWRDLRAIIRDNRAEWQREMQHHKEENDKSVDTLWKALRECQHDCCPRGRE